MGRSPAKFDSQVFLYVNDDLWGPYDITKISSCICIEDSLDD